MHDGYVPNITRMALVAMGSSLVICDIWHRHLIPLFALEVIAALALGASIMFRRSTYAHVVTAVALGVAVSVGTVDRLPGQRWATMNPMAARVEGVVEQMLNAASSVPTMEVWGTVDMRSVAPSRSVRIRVSIQGRDSSRPLPRQGERVVMFCAVRAPEAHDLPGAFSERSFALTRGVTWLAEARHRMVAVTADAGFVDQWLVDHRAWLAGYVARRYPEDVAAVVLGLLSGEKSDMTVHDRQAFIRAGTAHLLSVSGLHVGLVTGICLVLFTWCGTVGRFVLVVACVLAFVVFTGANPPAVRAGVVVLCAMLGNALERPAEPIRLLTIAVLGMWVYNPLVLYSASLHLSICACVGLIVVAPRVLAQLEQHAWAKHRGLRWLVRSISVSVAASTGVLLPAAWHLGGISFLSSVTNVVVVPLLSAAMMLSVAAGVAEPLSTAAAESIANVVTVCVRLGVWFTHVMADCEPTVPGHVVLVATLLVASTCWVVVSATGRHAVVRTAITTTLVWLSAGIPSLDRQRAELWHRYGMTVALRRWPHVTVVDIVGPDDYRRDRSLVASLVSEPALLVVHERGRAASRIIDAVERRRRLIRTAYLAERWNVRTNLTKPSR